MIGNRCLFVFITVFLIMVMTISTKPVHVHEEELPATEEHTEMTTIPNVVTDDLLFFGVTAMPIDKTMQSNEHLLFNKEDSMPVTPEADGPSSFNDQMTGDAMHTVNNDM